MNIRSSSLALCGILIVLPTLAPAQTRTLDQRVAALEALVTTLSAENTALKARLADDEGFLNTVLGRTRFMVVQGTSTKFVGTNVYIQKDSSSNETPNGLGNLIMGFNHVRSDGAATLREGSHNIVLGDQANYRSVHGLIGGFRNGVDQPYNVILSGMLNGCHNNSAVVLTGYKNNVNTDYGFIGTGYSNSTGFGTDHVGSYNFILSGQYNQAGYKNYSGILSGNKMVSYYVGGVSGTGKSYADSNGSDYSFSSN